MRDFVLLFSMSMFFYVKDERLSGKQEAYDMNEGGTKHKTMRMVYWDLIWLNYTYSGGMQEETWTNMEGLDWKEEVERSMMCRRLQGLAAWPVMYFGDGLCVLFSGYDGLYNI